MRVPASGADGPGGQACRRAGSQRDRSQSRVVAFRRVRKLRLIAHGIAQPAELLGRQEKVNDFGVGARPQGATGTSDLGGRPVTIPQRQMTLRGDDRPQGVVADLPAGLLTTCCVAVRCGDGAEEGVVLAARRQLRSPPSQEIVHEIAVGGTSGVVQRRTRVPFTAAPYGGTTVQLRYSVRTGPTEVGKEIGAQELLHAVVRPLPPDPHHQTGVVLQPVEQLRCLLPARQLDREASRYRIADGRGAQHLPLGFREADEHLPDEVVRHGALVAGERGDGRCRIRTVSQLQGRQPESRRPSSGSLVKHSDLLRRESNPVPLEQRSRLFRGEPQILRPELTELFLQAHPCDRQHGVAPGRKDEPQPRPGAAHHRLQAV